MKLWVNVQNKSYTLVIIFTFFAYFVSLLFSPTDSDYYNISKQWWVLSTWSWWLRKYHNRVARHTFGTQVLCTIHVCNNIKCSTNMTSSVLILFVVEFRAADLRTKKNKTNKTNQINKFGVFSGPIRNFIFLDVCMACADCIYTWRIKSV